MAETLCLFEDEGVVNLYPLTLTRPAFELRCGMSSLREKIVRELKPRKVVLHCRSYLGEAVREENEGALVNSLPEEDVLFVNGRLLIDGAVAKKIAAHRPAAFWQGEELVAAWVPASKIPELRSKLADFFHPQWLSDLPRIEVEARLIVWPWDLIHYNADEIRREFSALGLGGQLRGKIYPNVSLIGKENIFVGEKAELWPGVVIMAEEGPVYIADGATIMANAVIVGPSYIGPKSMIKIGAKIYEGTSVGEVCKVGGEVEESIIHAYSNKQHEGFLGHAYLGTWVNLGADTNNSDLKNNYAPVRVQINDRLVDTGSLFVGLFMGDHTKTGINTMFNTGTVVGVACNVYGEGFPPRFIPSFHWGGARGLAKYSLEKTLETARRVMARRNKELTPAQEAVLRRVYEMPAPPILDKGATM
ncbi:MAG: GlmU family protein [candidate division KSB1 bacterium]|nr:GlmU family protein [candidate division KSB1 bacterium]